MDNDQKKILISKAIREDRTLTFDYVSKDFSISFNRKVRPTELTDTHLWAEDLEKKHLRQFLIDGIQKLKVGIPYARWKEIEHES